QTTAPHHSGGTTAPHHSGGTTAPHHSGRSRSGAIVGGSRQGSKVVNARPTPATSRDDTTRTALANSSNPCTLVSLAEAPSFTGGAIAGRVEAPLGPTCIYARKGSAPRFPLAIESVNFRQ